MRWKEEGQSTNVEDRRTTGGRVAMGGGIGTILLVAVYALMGGDLSQIGGMLGSDGGSSAPLTEKEKEQGQFVSAVLASTERVWPVLFQQMGKTYVPPKMVLFRGGVNTGCGNATSAVGPFYCPADKTVYIDLSFYDELQNRFKAGGDFAQAYVIAHEVGHHVQNLLGISEKAHALEQRGSKTEANRVSVRLELQADFFAGVWAHHAEKTRHILDPGDIDEAVTAAQAIGDDRLQQQSRGSVVPESFTHGTSAQRSAWFRHGFETGDVRKGDTFNDELFYSVTPK